MDRLKGKIAVITGGAGGIGLGTVERFVAEGARVMVGDIDDAAGSALKNRFGGEVDYRPCDVMQESDIEGLMAAAVERFGGLDIVFNNAGAGGSPQRIEEMTGAAWDFSQNLLLRSVALGIRYAIPHLRARGGGSIVNTASIAGMQAGAGPIAYSVAKAGVIHLPRVAAAELARDGIRLRQIGQTISVHSPAQGDTAKQHKRRREFIPPGKGAEKANRCLHESEQQADNWKPEK